MKHTLPTVSIGIPAFNEAANIVQLLKRLLSQKFENTRLLEIILYTDASTDGTPELAEKIGSELVTVRRGAVRVGQQELQNKMLRSFKGDCLVIIEADMLPSSYTCIESLVLPLFEKNSKYDMVVGVPKAIEAQTFFERIMVYSGKVRLKLFKSWKNGDNVFRCGGHSAKAISKKFAEKLIYPTDVPEDAFTYFKLKELGLQFKTVAQAEFLMRHVTNFNDRVKQCSKYISGKNALKSFFGNDTVEKAYSIPKLLLFKTYLLAFFKNPFFTFFTLVELCLNRLYTRNAKKFSAKHESYTSSKTLTLEKKSKSSKVSLKYLKIFITSSILLSSIIATLVLGVSVHGNWGNPSSFQLNTPDWKEDGALELSPDRGRFALTYSLLEDRSFSFSIPVAQFAAPDVAQKDGKFVSLFAPGLSYVIMPGYLVGKQFSVSQVGAFATITIFALINAFLMYQLARGFGASKPASLVGTFIGIFASPAFAYAVTLYQHHVSSFCVLFSLWLLQKYKDWKPLPFVWFLCAASIVIDNPNLFLMTPIGLYSLGRIFTVEKINIKSQEVVTFSVNFFRIFTVFTMIFPIVFFMYFNKQSYGNPYQLSGTVASAEVVTDEGHADISDISKKELEKKQLSSEPKKKKTALGFFKTRRLVDGFYTHFISEDRGILTFTPVILFGFIGLYFIFKNNSALAQVIAGSVGANILLYSMWGDPYGGWAFGSRYLVPTYLLLGICISVLLHRFAKNIFVLLVVLGLAIFSIRINTIGAVTSNRIPPKIEVLGLEAITLRRERYSYDRNMEMLDSNKSKSFTFIYGLSKYLTAWQFTNIIWGSISTLVVLNVLLLTVQAHIERKAE